MTQNELDALRSTETAETLAAIEALVKEHGLAAINISETDGNCPPECIRLANGNCVCN